MKLRKTVILFLTLILAFPFAAFADNSFEQSTKTYINPWLSHYNLATKAEAESGIVGGEGGQRINGYAISRSNPDVQMITTDICGIYRSTDGGASWENKSVGLGAFNHTNIIFHPENENIAFALGTCPEEHMYRIDKPGSKSGIMVTYDCGETWQLSKKLPFAAKATQLLAATPADNDGNSVIFAATNYVEKGYESGLFRSRDNGKLWECIGYENVKFTGVYTGRTSGIVIAFGKDTAKDANVFIVSYDRGENWEDKSSITDDMGFLPDALAIHPTHEKELWIAGKGEKLEEIRNGARKGEYSTALTDNEYYTKDLKYPIQNISYLVYGAPNEKGAAVLYCGGNATHFNMKYSKSYRDDFTAPTFENTASDSTPGYYVKATCPHPTEYGTTFTADVMQNIYVSRKGEEYYRKSAGGYSTYMTKAIAFEGSEIKYMGFVDKGIAKTESGYDGFYKPVEIITNGLVSYDSSKSVRNILVDPKNSEHVFFTVGSNNEGGMLGETKDGFETSELRNDIIPSGESLSKISDLFRHNQNPDIIYAGKYVSFDNGVTFEKIQYPVKAMDPINSDIVYYVTSEKKLMRSADCGKSWEDTEIVCDDYYRILETDCKESGIIYTDRKRVNVAEKTPEDIRPALYSDTEAFSLAQNPDNPDHLFYCLRYLKQNGPYACIESFDGGKSWHKVDGINDMAGMTDVIFIPNTTKAYLCGSQGTFVYDYGIYENSLLYEGKASAYTSPLTKNYIISGEAKPEAIVTVKITDDKGNIAHIAETAADSEGGFSYKFRMEGEADDYYVMLNDGYGVVHGVVIHYSDSLVDIASDSISLDEEDGKVKITLQLDNLLGDGCTLTAASYIENELADVVQSRVFFPTGKREYILELDQGYDEIKLFLWNDSLVPYMTVIPVD